MSELVPCPRCQRLYPPGTKCYMVVRGRERIVMCEPCWEEYDPAWKADYQRRADESQRRAEALRQEAVERAAEEAKRRAQEEERRKVTCPRCNNHPVELVEHGTDYYPRLCQPCHEHLAAVSAAQKERHARALAAGEEFRALATAEANIDYLQRLYRGGIFRSPHPPRRAQLRVLRYRRQAAAR